MPAAAPAGGEASTVAAAYRRFWAVSVGLDRRPRDQWRPALAAVATEPLLGRVYDGLVGQRESGVVEYGGVVPHPSVVAVGVGRASVLDCQDASRSGELDLDTGLPRTVGSARTPVAATLVRGGDGEWRVAEARYLDGGC
jgi:hypothetical protein